MAIQGRFNTTMNQATLRNSLAKFQTVHRIKCFKWGMRVEFSVQSPKETTLKGTTMSRR